MTSGDLNSSFDEFKSFFFYKKKGEFLSNKNYVLMKKSLQK